MPAYNTGKFIGYAIESVIKQTYINWELIIVNDCSTDNTLKIIQEYKKKDSRIKFFQNNKNEGAAESRNKAIRHSEGKFIAFLDSDDVWFPFKLEKQINIMDYKNYPFTCTSYTKIGERNEDLNMTRTARKKSDYDELLKEGPGNSTVIYNSDMVGEIQIPNIRKRNDYVMWLQVIKKTNCLYGIQESLSSYRIRENSLSSNKFSLVKYHWKVYRDIEELSILKSIYLILYMTIVTVFNLR